MSGVSWNERQPSDWLASNGRWYAASEYPRGWSTSALPPAPGHGDAGSILRRLVVTTGGPPASSSTYDLGSDDDDSVFYDDDDSVFYGSSEEDDEATGQESGWTVGSNGRGSQQASAPAPPGSSVVPTGRRVADATITEPDSPTRPPLPAPPGRLAAPTQPPAPSAAKPRPPSASQPAAPKPSTSGGAESASSNLDVVAGDLGRVLGTAKKRIERAINEASEY